MSVTVDSGVTLQLHSALRSCDVTDAQAAAIIRLARSEGCTNVLLGPGGFDLPAGYITFRQTYRYGDGGSIYGGIAPDGAVST